MSCLQKIRVLTISAVAVLLIVMAVTFSVMRALLPHATGYIEDVKNELTLQLGLPVSIQSLDADMDWLTPRLKVIDLIVYKKNGKDILFHFSEANFSLAYIDSLRYLFPVVGEINLVGAELFIERHGDSRWVIQGYEINSDLAEKSSETSQLVQTLKNIDYSLLDSHVHWRDFTRKTDAMEFKGVDVKIESFLGTRNFDIKLNLPKQFGDTLQITAELDGDILFLDKLKGKIYFKGTSLNIEKWLSKFEVDVDVSGFSNASLWLHFSGNKIKKISGELSNTDIDISNLKHSNVIWDAQQVDFLFLYRKLSNGWRLDVEQLGVVKNNKEWLHKSKLLFKDSVGVEQAFSADYLRLEDVIPLAYIFTDIKDDEMLKQVNLKGISGDVYNVNAKISDANKGRFVSATIEDMAFNLKDEKINGEGIDGTIILDNNDIKLSLDSRLSRLELPQTFRAPIELDTVTGDVNISSSSNGFSIQSSRINVDNSDLSLVSRIEMNQLDGVNHLDMQVDFFDVDTDALHKYYPVNALSASVIEWTDDAINEGRSEKGSFVFRGNPDYFPFHDSEGVMEVDFSVEDLNLHYLDGWPNLKHLDANIRFYNESLTIEGGIGRTQGSEVYDVKAVIPDLEHPLLTVTGKAESDASNIQKFVWNSGLDDLLGNALKQFNMMGDG